MVKSNDKFKFKISKPNGDIVVEALAFATNVTSDSFSIKTPNLHCAWNQHFRQDERDWKGLWDDCTGEVYSLSKISC